MGARKLKLLTVVGARPQFIKAAVVSAALAAANRSTPELGIEEELLHTGQHYDHELSDVFFAEMELPRPVVNLGVGSGGHGATTGAMLAGIERELLARRPHAVMVYGDTNSTLAGALAAAKLRVPVVHVEAGLRCADRFMAEEINRVTVDHLSTVLFCPGEAARANLAKEGITTGVHVVGDVMYDAVLRYRRRVVPPPIAEPFVLATIHRAENTDDPERLRAIFAALAEAPFPVLLPLHPRTRKMLELAGVQANGRVRLQPPASYLAMLGYLERCAFVVTDSGGLQKEAFYFGKRCLTLRPHTEWTELVACGANRLVDTEALAIREAFAWAREPLPKMPPLFEQGAAARIAQLLPLVLP
jgi:UDP-N-acetylglucosamine 2-epimerase